jgi:hypothetical protein
MLEELRGRVLPLMMHLMKHTLRRRTGSRFLCYDIMCLAWSYGAEAVRAISICAVLTMLQGDVYR